ncbi:Putative oxidoreductase DltE [Tolypocladium paradoxum]|uniref:Oxidoreductase DltE n=1 Tax=Tolypocladium paradoxum TaxID=94208 RepID=A0A2S4KPU1_9HYPO|nr:Putative oxidoreductase DltE [Tolypocladium paradoxum]
MAPQDPLGFKCAAAATSGGGGIGKGIAQYFVSKGKKVLIAGRTESNLQSTAKEIGAAGYYVLDTGKSAEIPSFVEKITAEHPDLDCPVNNAGVQWPLEVVKDDAFLSKADQEIDSKPSALIINVSSILGFVPFVIVNPVAKSSIRVVEIAPPLVATDLHRERSDPDEYKKNPNALSVDEFMNEVSEKLERGDEMINAGLGNEMVDKWCNALGDRYPSS